MSAQTDIMMDILNQIKQHPLSDFFYRPMTDNKETGADYEQKIQNPISFLIIENKVKNNEYKELQEFKRDVDLIFENAQKYFPEDSIIAKASLFFEKIVKKIMMQFEKPIWMTFVSNKRNKIQDLLLNPAKSKYPHSGLDLGKNVIDQLVNEEIYARVKKNNALITQPENQMILISLLRELQPEVIGSALTIPLDLTKLRPATLRALDDKMKEIVARIAPEQKPT